MTKSFSGDGDYALLLGSHAWHHCILPNALVAMATIIIIGTSSASDLRHLCNTHVMCLMHAKCRCILSLHCVNFPNYNLHRECVDIVNVTKLLHTSIRRPVRKVKTHIILISNWQFK